MTSFEEIIHELKKFIALLPQKERELAENCMIDLRVLIAEKQCAEFQRNRSA